MTPAQSATVEAAMAGIDDAMRLLELELRRVQRALDHGIPFEIIGALNRIANQGQGHDDFF